MTTRMIAADDRGLHPLFGDAVAATALESAGAALELDELDELLQAASASVATPSTAADLRTVVRFMHSPSHETADAVVLAL
jgi:3-oxoacyl-[acyl-carrier-protein] synthase III